MMPMQENQPFSDQKAEPDEERHFLGLAQVFLQSPGDFGVRLLQHVRWIDARPQTQIEPHLHHAAQTVAMQSENRVQGLRIAQSRPLDQFDAVVGTAVH